MADPEILVTGREATDDEIGKNAKATIAKLIDNGWSIGIVGYAEAYIPPEIYASGDRAGEAHGEKTIQQVWINAYHLDRKRTINVTYYNDYFELCLWNRRNSYPGEEVDSREMIELIKGEWEDKLPGQMWKLWKQERAAENKELREAAAERARLRKEGKK